MFDKKTSNPLMNQDKLMLALASIICRVGFVIRISLGRTFGREVKDNLVKDITILDQYSFWKKYCRRHFCQGCLSCRITYFFSFG
jgi:5-methylcytosine-specific restriction endonuclease McrBC GTP-binding regulatory subunit McrB